MTQIKKKIGHEKTVNIDRVVCDGWFFDVNGMCVVLHDGWGTV